MELRVIRTEAEFDRLKPQWDAFLAKLDPVPLPLTHNWLKCWWNAFSADSEMEFRCAYLNGDLVGIAPLMRTREIYRGIPVTLLKLAVNGHTPYSSVVVDAGVSGPQRERILAALTEVTPTEIGVFFKIGQDCELRQFLMDGSGAAARTVGQKPSLCTPVIAINTDWDEFYRTRPGKLRKSLRHKLNRVEKEGRFSICEEHFSGVDEAILRELEQVSARSWKSSVGNDLKSNDQARRFLLNLAEQFGPSGSLSAWIMRSGETPVAFELHLRCDDVVYPIRADFDENFKAFSPGSVLEYTALRHLFEKGGCREYYTCADDYWYLSNWTSDYRKHCTVELFGNSPRLRALYLVEYRLIPLVKRLFGKKDRTVRPA